MRLKMGAFKDYCKQDVITEYEILKRLEQYPVPEEEEFLWQMDIRMNAYGVRVDEELINGALAIDAISSENLTMEAIDITGLGNPNSTSQLKVWIEKQISGEISGLTKENVTELLSRSDISDEVRRVLEIRQQLGKTSIKKYVAMKTAEGEGERVRGLTQFYGANRTGRWAGRLVQMQNLPRNYLKTLDEARKLVKAKNYEGVRLIYENVPDTLSQLIRTAFIPSEGQKFVVADFSAIEARVIAWLAGEQWVNEVFATHGKSTKRRRLKCSMCRLKRLQRGIRNTASDRKERLPRLHLGIRAALTL